MLILGLLDMICTLMLWWYLCQVLTFIQIGCGHTVIIRNSEKSKIGDSFMSNQDVQGGFNIEQVLLNTIMKTVLTRTFLCSNIFQKVQQVQNGMNWFNFLLIPRHLKAAFDNIWMKNVIIGYEVSKYILWYFQLTNSCQKGSKFFSILLKMQLEG